MNIIYFCANLLNIIYDVLNLDSAFVPCNVLLLEASVYAVVHVTSKIATHQV